MKGLWKMFAAVLAFAIVITHVGAEIPSFIHVCSRNEPNLDKCILDNVNNLKGKICEGIPEMNIEPNDPFFIENLVISDTTNTKLYLKDTTLEGLCDVEVNFLHVDLDKLHFDVDLTFNRFQLNSTYEFDIRLLVNIAHKGAVYITTENTRAKVGMDMKLATVKGKKHIYMSKMKINLDIKGYDAKYNLNARELARLEQIIDSFIGNNQEEIINTFKPIIEETVSKRVLLLSNEMLKHFTYEELFPQRT